ncbi:hypothetical protein AMJ39_04795 [candidate division TA06 bacterium DG_24]|uniref:Undecaprenyl-diphosphatase n=3 Tax=Bacteria division TA06 TaxID=1156500 RepID=A0A0S8JBB5_UNCT6|nr:MAG: hypothetical protein AMJ39_04795 [candidate division TA06 bacterium DG_24]KPK67431.1 MAG: hypothetical protein AMJ82_10655 [candidate division TA06 bacterium SM23_40]KPL05902.1 MAG: hypothetical protein AMJ71_10505 [candidate division TA06 bacterium SM1_40]
MTLIQALVLGLVQGLTEFLPVSSSGHLVLARELLGAQTHGIVFEVMVHFATMVAIIVVFRRRLWWILSRLGSREDEGRSARRLILYIIIGTIPAGMAGLFLDDLVERAFQSTLLVSLALAATGGILWLTRFAPGGRGSVRADRSVGENRSSAAERSVGVYGAWAIGCAQALALLPGISRAGWTIAAGLLLGVDAEEAVEFSFLLALPAIAGATAKELLSAQGEGLGLFNPVAVSAGMPVAFLSGWLALLFLVRIVRRGKLARFAFYCWAVALLGFVVAVR